MIDSSPLCINMARPWTARNSSTASNTNHVVTMFDASKLVRLTIPSDKRFINLSGNRFGRWHVIAYAGKDRRRKSFFKCQCDCGNENIVSGCDLTSGKSKSCGCLNDEINQAARTTHGMTCSPEYSSWRAMKDRCNDNSNIGYHRYGGRGIVVCK